MTVFSKAALAALVVALAGCATAPSAPIALNPGAANSGRIAVGIAPLPKVDMSYPGASCLLCLAAAAATNRTLSLHAETLPSDDLSKIKAQLAQVIGKKNASVSVVEAPVNVDALPSASGTGPNATKKDFASLKQTLGADKLLLIEIQSVGMERSYSAYIPNGAPRAILRGAGYLVNLSTNTYEWYQPVSIARAADGSWDEPPKFPGLTNAYFQVLEMGKDELIKPFAAP